MKTFKDICEAETADQAFKRNLSDVKGMLKIITKGVNDMAKEQKKEPLSYGYAGSMSQIRQELEDINSFLKG